MFRYLPAPITGTLVALVFILNTILWAIPLYSLAFVKLLTPWEGGRRGVTVGLNRIAELWAVCDVWIVAIFLNVEWDIRGDANLRRNGSYMVLSNHQSWNDIFVAMHTMIAKIPFFKFFLKQELIWVPILGGAWWALDFPFMKRYSREMVARRPELKGKDLETTRIACQRYAGRPVTVFNYLEGTRFTAAKRDSQGSPYRNLLLPKAGGFAFVMNAMGTQLDSIIDVTIVYPDGVEGFWGLLSGRMRRVIVHICERPIPPEMVTGDYQEDAEFRQRFQDWVAEIWREKDERIEQIKADVANPSSSG